MTEIKELLKTTQECERRFSQIWQNGVGAPGPVIDAMICLNQMTDLLEELPSKFRKTPSGETIDEVLYCLEEFEKNWNTNSDAYLPHIKRARYIL